MQVNEILEQRGNNYGEFSTIANLTQHLEYTALKHFQDVHPDQPLPPPYMREALHMIFQKVARVVNGNPYYDDSWQDIAGYAQLVVDELHKTNKTVVNSNVTIKETNNDE